MSEVVMSEAWYREQAEEEYAARSDDDIEIDTDADVDVTEDGAWIQARVWIRAPDTDGWKPPMREDG